MNDSLDQTLIFPPQRKRPEPIVSDFPPAHRYPAIGHPRWCSPNDPCRDCEDYANARYRQLVAGFGDLGGAK